METNTNLQPELQFSYTINPVKNLQYSMSGLLGNFNAELVNQFYPPIIGKRLNIIISELVNNVYENKADECSKLFLSITIQGEEASIVVKNKVTPAQFESVRKHINTIKKSVNSLTLLSETMRARRCNNLKGGLGLIRLASENKALLSVRYDKSSSYMTLNSKLILKESII